MTAYIGLGANLGERRRQLLLAWQRLGERPGIHPSELSSPYETAPVEMASSHWFINAVGRLETDLGPQALLAALLAVEEELGRDRANRDRTVDLDLLLYDALIVEEAGCRIPHPALAHRPFVLVPLAEIAPRLRHPESGLTAAEMLAHLSRSGGDIRRTSWQKEEHAPA